MKEGDKIKLESYEGDILATLVEMKKTTLLAKIINDPRKIYKKNEIYEIHRSCLIIDKFEDIIEYKLKSLFNKDLNNEQILWAQIVNKNGTIIAYTVSPVGFINEGSIITRLIKK